MTTITYDGTRQFAPSMVDVDAPTRLPRPFGLYSVATVVDMVDAHQANGATFLPEPFDPSSSLVDGCTPADERTKDIIQSVDWQTALPYTVFDGFTCAPVGFTDDERERRARQAILNGEERAVESLIATGQSTNGETTVGLLDVQTIDASTPDKAATALGHLEETIASEYGGVGVIHIAVDAVAMLAHATVIERNGPRLVTISGGNYVTGNPFLTANSGLTTVQVAITGSVNVWRNAIVQVGDVRSSIDRRTNTLTRIVERTVLVGTDYNGLGQDA